MCELQNLKKVRVKRFLVKNCFKSLVIRKIVRSLKCLKYVQAPAKRTSSPMKTPYELLNGILPLSIGKFTTGKLKISLLS